MRVTSTKSHSMRVELHAPPADIVQKNCFLLHFVVLLILPATYTKFLQHLAETPIYHIFSSIPDFVECPVIFYHLCSSAGRSADRSRRPRYSGILYVVEKMCWTGSLSLLVGHTQQNNSSRELVLVTWRSSSCTVCSNLVCPRAAVPLAKLSVFGGKFLASAKCAVSAPSSSSAVTQPNKPIYWNTTISTAAQIE